MEDKRGVAGEMADGTEQVALVFGWVMLDDGNFGVTVVAETVEPVGGSGGADKWYLYLKKYLRICFRCAIGLNSQSE